MKSVQDLLRKVVEFRAMDLKKSVSSRKRSSDEWASLAIDEALEFIEVFPQDKEESLKEVGDVVGNVVSLLYALPYSTEDFQKIFSYIEEKFQRRKPWIFDDFSGQVPTDPKEEQTQWYENKNTHG